jgi:hypothetical protein
MNDHQVATATDRIRLIAIEIMKGAFGNEGALRSSVARRHAQMSVTAVIFCLIYMSICGLRPRSDFFQSPQ